MTDIRKISVGKDFPDKVIHYQVGKQVNLQGNPYTITKILLRKDLLEIGKLAFTIYITDEYGTVEWKTIIDVPTVVENNIDFD